MMLANDDFGVDAKIAGTAKNFDYTANRSGAFAGDIRSSTLTTEPSSLANVRKASGLRGVLLPQGSNCSRRRGREFVAGGKLDIVLDAGIVGDNNAAARGVAEKADNGGMRAGDDAKNATFGAARAGESAEARNFTVTWSPCMASST